MQDFSAPISPSANTNRSNQAQSMLVLGRHFTAHELFKLWLFSESIIRRFFIKEPGRIRIAHEETRRGAIDRREFPNALPYEFNVDRKASHEKRRSTPSSKYCMADSNRQTINFVSHRNDDGSATDFSSGSTCGSVGGQRHEMAASTATIVRRIASILERTHSTRTWRPAVLYAPLPFVHKQGLTL